MKNIRICKYCGRLFTYTEGRGKIFCSLKCRDKYKKWSNVVKWVVGGKDTYGKRIKKYQRNEVKRNYNYTCSNCGRYCKETIQVHHIDGNRLNNNYSNLMLLCPNCHSLTENYSKRKVNYEESKNK